MAYRYITYRNSSFVLVARLGHADLWGLLAQRDRWWLLTLLPRLKEVREVRSITHQGLFFRATRFFSITGLMFEAVARRTRKDDEP